MQNVMENYIRHENRFAVDVKENNDRIKTDKKYGNNPAKLENKRKPTIKARARTTLFLRYNASIGVADNQATLL